MNRFAQFQLQRHSLSRTISVTKAGAVAWFNCCSTLCLFQASCFSTVFVVEFSIAQTHVCVVKKSDALVHGGDKARRLKAIPLLRVHHRTSLLDVHDSLGDRHLKSASGQPSCNSGSTRLLSGVELGAVQSLVGSLAGYEGTGGEGGLLGWRK
jgi:hypothetical protein